MLSRAAGTARGTRPRLPVATKEAARGSASGGFFWRSLGAGPRSAASIRKAAAEAGARSSESGASISATGADACEEPNSEGPGLAWAPQAANQWRHAQL